MASSPHHLRNHQSQQKRNQHLQHPLHIPPLPLLTPHPSLTTLISHLNPHKLLHRLHPHPLLPRRLHAPPHPGQPIHTPRILIRPIPLKPVLKHPRPPALPLPRARKLLQRPPVTLKLIKRHREAAARADLLDVEPDYCAQAGERGAQFRGGRDQGVENGRVGFVDCAAAVEAQDLGRAGEGGEEEGQARVFVEVRDCFVAAAAEVEDCCGGLAMCVEIVRGLGHGSGALGMWGPGLRWVRMGMGEGI